jgi:flagella basal body P-ring formation protein FlgA
MIPFLACVAACLSVQSDRITAGDVARAVPAFRALPSGKVLSYAPLPGHSRVFPEAELRQRVPDAQDLPASVCFEWPMRVLPEQEMREAMLAVLPQGASVKILDAAKHLVPPGPVEFPLTALRSGMWKGRVVWAPGRFSDVWAKVAVEASYARVVAVTAIRSGQRITGSDVRLEAGRGEPVLPGAASDPDRVIGCLARRLVPPGAPVPAASLDCAVAVGRGDPVHVRIVTGNMAIAFDGVSEGRAGVGDLVPVRNPHTKRVIHARVQSRGAAVAELGGSRR